MKTLLCAIVLAFTITSQATVYYYNYTVKATMLIQDGTNSVTSTKYKLTTKDLLTYLSQSEFFAGNYGYAEFPFGSRLVYEYDTESGGRFIVQDASRNFLCDVSDILWLEFTSSTVYGPGTSTYLESLVFDNTTVGMDLNFQLSYLTTESDKLGIVTCKSISGVGDGDLRGRGMVLTGSCSSTTK